MGGKDRTGSAVEGYSAVDPFFFCEVRRCYDTAYMANLSEVEVFYPQTIAYYDGI